MPDNEGTIIKDDATRNSPWTVGDRVRTNLEHAWVYAGTEREGLMGKDRRGTIVEVPPATQAQGSGTVLVRWESLTQTPLKRAEWWTHTDLILRAGSAK